MIKKASSSAEEREKIIHITLKLLSTIPPECITIARVAKELALSEGELKESGGWATRLTQLFFSQEELLDTASDLLRKSLSECIEVFIQSELPTDKPSKHKLKAFLLALSRISGFPGVFESNFTLGTKDTSYQIKLQHGASMVKSLLAEIVKQSKEVPDKVSSGRAAEILLLLVCASARKYRDELVERLEELVEFWLVGVKSGLPPRVDLTPEQCAVSNSFVALDVRPIIGEGRDPLSVILETLESLVPDGILHLTAPFKPEPLIVLLNERACRVIPENPAINLWTLLILKQKDMLFEDFSDLEAPEPLEHTLELVSAMKLGESAWVRVPRVANLLFSHLERKGVLWEYYPEPVGTVLVCLRKKK